MSTSWRTRFGSAAGRELLASNGIYSELTDFVSQLGPPLSSELSPHLSSRNELPVWAGQQLYADVTHSMVERIEKLQALSNVNDIAPFFLWLDTDRAGSDFLMTRFRLPLNGKMRMFRVCKRAERPNEMRFVQLDPHYLNNTYKSLGKFYLNSMRGKLMREKASRQLQPIGEMYQDPNPGTLSAFNGRLCRFLLDGVGLHTDSVILSELLADGVLSAAINAVLNNLADVVTVYNEAVSDLKRRDIDPQVSLLPDDYLPLNYACPLDNRRLKLHREQKAADHFAVAGCKCGNIYRFYLGAESLSIAELERQGRWSPDILLTLFLNETTSGYVGGISSTVYYGLVMQPVLEKVLGKKRIPILAPSFPDKSAAQTEAPDSLLYDYLRIT